MSDRVIKDSNALDVTAEVIMETGENVKQRLMEGLGTPEAKKTPTVCSIVTDILEVHMSLLPFLGIALFVKSFGLFFLTVAVTVVQSFTISLQLMPDSDGKVHATEEFVNDLHRMLLCAKQIANGFVVSVVSHGNIFVVVSMLVLHIFFIVSIWGPNNAESGECAADMKAADIPVHERRVLFSRALTSLCVLAGDSDNAAWFAGMSLVPTAVEVLLLCVEKRCFRLFSEAVKQLCFFFYVFFVAASVS
jgi:hypothetical protein